MMIKKVMLNSDVIMKSIEKEENKVLRQKENYDRSEEMAYEMVIFGGLGLIVHILILMLLCHVLLSDIYSALKKISVYFVTRFLLQYRCQCQKP